MNSAQQIACTISEMYGVPHLGWTRPKAGGRKRSIPATKGIRDSAARYAPTPPRFDTQISKATIGARPVQPTRSALLEMACMMPSRLLTLGSATSTAMVPRMYPAVMMKPAAISPRGMVRRASLISPPMNEADSAPLKAYSSVAHTPKLPKFNEGFIDDALKLVAEPNFHQATPPTTQSS